MQGLVGAMVYHYPKALEDTHSTTDKVRVAFQLPMLATNPKKKIVKEVNIEHKRSIQDIDKDEWNGFLGKQGAFDWDGLLFLENVFTNNKLSENNWDFHYFIIKDQDNHPILATFFTYALWKDDMLAPVSVSGKLEEIRKNDPYYLSSHVLGMGSPFTEGQHLYLDRTHVYWKLAIKQLLDKVEELQHQTGSNMVVLRDFEKDNELSNLFHQQGFVNIMMPDSCQIFDLSWNSVDDYIQSLSTRSRRHFRKDILPYEEHFDIVCLKEPDPHLVDQFYKLHMKVNGRKPGLGMGPLPKKLFTTMS